MNNQEHCQHEFVGYRICCYCGFCKNYEGEIVSPYITSNIKQLADDFEKWYFGIKEQSGKPPLAMQIFYWFSQRMRCKIETDDTTPAPASESRDAQPAKPDEGSGPVWVKANKRMPLETGTYFIKSESLGKIICHIQDLSDAKKYLNNCEWLDETGSAATDNGKEAKEEDEAWRDMFSHYDALQRIGPDNWTLNIDIVKKSFTITRKQP